MKRRLNTDRDIRPNVPRDLADWLDRTYPEVTPGTEESINSIMKYSGKREIVKLLKEYAYESDKR